MTSDQLINSSANSFPNAPAVKEVIVIGFVFGLVIDVPAGPFLAISVHLDETQQEIV